MESYFDCSFADIFYPKPRGCHLATAPPKIEAPDQSWGACSPRPSISLAPLGCHKWLNRCSWLTPTVLSSSQWVEYFRASAVTQKETKGGRNIALPALLGKSSCPISIVCKRNVDKSLLRNAYLWWALRDYLDQVYYTLIGQMGKMIPAK